MAMSQSNKLCYYTLAIIMLLGLHLRLQAVRQTVVDTPIRADARGYVFYAINLNVFHAYSRSPDAIEGKTATPQPDAVCNPAYPLFLTLFFGDNFSEKTILLITLAQALLSTLTIGFVYMASTAIIPRSYALLSALFTALSPHLVTANVYLLTESLFCFLLILFLWLLSRWRTSPSNALLLGTGAVLALATLTRPWTQYFIVPLMLLVATSPHIVRPKRCAALLGLGFFVLMGLWAGRNLSAVGSISDNTLMISTLHSGIYPGMMYENRPETLGYPYRFDPRVPEIVASMHSVSMEIVRRFREQPMEYFQWYILGKPVMLFSWNIYEGPGDVFIYPVLYTPYADSMLFHATHEIMRTLHEWLVALAALGCLIAWLPGARLGMGDGQLFFVHSISSLFAYFVLIHSIGAPFARYSIPMQPVVYVLALFSIWQMARLSLYVFHFGKKNL